MEHIVPTKGLDASTTLQNNEVDVEGGGPDLARIERVYR